MTKKRIYQLGETTAVRIPEFYAIIANKNKIIEEHGEEGWRLVYHNICDDIRDIFEFPYLIAIDTYIGTDEYIAVTVFEIEKDKVDTATRVYDEEKKMCYIEVEEELLA